MILSKKNKVIFLHLPKTAGTSIASALHKHLSSVISGGKKTPWDYHTSILSFEQRVSSLDDFFIFTFVRNPWDRLYSWYCMLSNNRKAPISNARFKKWLLAGCHDMASAFPPDSGKKPAQTVPQVEYMLDSTGKNRVQFVGRFEQVQADYGKLCKKLKVKGSKLPHSRKGKHNSYLQAYDQEMVDFVREHHALDIEKFGYDFATA